MKDFKQWDGFAGRLWKEGVDVRDFIQNNYTPYDGDDSFLEGPTEATDKLWGKLQELQKEERAKGGVLDMETEVVSGLTAYGPGYIDESMKDLEKVVGLQTDKPLKRAFMPYGGINMAVKACTTYGYEPNERLKEIFTKYHKTHNQGVFDIYTPVELIKAIMMQESGGRGLDPMQCSEGSFNTKYPKQPNGITDPEYSISCGVQEIKSCLERAGVKNPLDMENIKLALQSYNYGNGYLEWAKARGGYTLANAAEFSDMMAQRMGWSSYGDKQYVPHVLQYKGRIRDGSYTPVAGDIIFFDWGNNGTIDHVGIVESVSGGTVNTIEGNSGDKVARRSYSIGSSNIYGYGVPAY